MSVYFENGAEMGLSFVLVSGIYAYKKVSSRQNEPFCDRYMVEGVSYFVLKGYAVVPFVAKSYCAEVSE